MKLPEVPSAGLSLLVAEDDKVASEFLARMIAKQFPGSVVHLAENGLRGVELFQEHRPDIVITDISMPVMDGIEMAVRIRALEPGAHIIAVTANSDTQYLMDAIKAGINRYVLKPIDMKKLFDSMEDCSARVTLKRQLKAQDDHIRAEREKAEENLRGFNLELEQRVQERTGELASANLQLKEEIEERKRMENSLQESYAEIKRLKDQLQAENIYLQQEVSQQFNFGEIIGKSKAISRVFTQINQVASVNATVLLTGETGTGKGVVARAIHSVSARKDRPLITVNCTTLPASLIESELFGREKGAFTGAGDRQMGRFEVADGGTIFLDEIGELPMELQSKLLRVLQDGEFERLGSSRTIRTDVRIIAATNRNLELEMREGRFREDLFYRLNVFPIMLPPLRQRKEDIPLLVQHFLAKYNKKIGKQIATVSKENIETLQHYHWPGNVRELESLIERSVITSQGTSLQVSDRFDSFPVEANVQEAGDVWALADLEHQHILQVLVNTGWRIEGEKGAALILGLNASTLRARMRKYGITRV